MIDPIVLASAFVFMAVVGGVVIRLQRRKLKPLPRPNRVPYDSKTFRK